MDDLMHGLPKLLIVDDINANLVALKEKIDIEHNTNFGKFYVQFLKNQFFKIYLGYGDTSVVVICQLKNGEMHVFLNAYSNRG